MQLATAASHAVDFQKTGTSAIFRDLPRPPSTLKPDFLAPESADATDTSRFYPSEKLLGILYRRVPSETPPRPLAPDASPLGSEAIYGALQEVLITLRLFSLDTPSDDVMVEMENLLHDYYSDKLFSIAQTHTLSRVGAKLTEGELVSGTIQAKWRDHKRRREAVNAMNLQV
jgi:RNA-dependent RNA polymerase